MTEFIRNKIGGQTCERSCCGRLTGCTRHNTKRGDYNAREGKWTSYVAKAVDKYEEGDSDQSFFPPSVRTRLRQEIPIFPEFTAMVTGHEKLKSYFYRSGLRDDPHACVKKNKR
jgi:hypothetical protein